MELYWIFPLGAICNEYYSLNVLLYFSLSECEIFLFEYREYCGPALEHNM